VRVIRTLRVMWRGLETGISYGSPRQSSTLPNSSSDTPVSAWVKSEELVTANGPYLSVSDAYDHNTYATTKETVGTTVRYRVEHEFQTGPVAKLISCMTGQHADTRAILSGGNEPATVCSACIR
jgi:hypothetical protein